MHPISAESPLTPHDARALLAMLPAEITEGMSDRELDRIEEELEFRFAPEHRTLLGEGLPVGGRRWPDWRNEDRESLAERLAGPVDGVLFDVQNNAFWHPGWGSRPESSGDATDKARSHLADVPVMVPIFSHRYLLADPDRTGTPVLSMHQTDIIYYGTDLIDYPYREFGNPVPAPAPADHRYATIPFWSSFLE
jgi:hypothetical protein